MDSWAQLNDFSEYEGTLPCVLCKADSSKTIVGGHWKCSVCAHLFNQDGSALNVECYCETCAKAKAEKEPKGMSLADIVEKFGGLKDKIKTSKKKVVKAKKKKTK